MTAGDPATRDDPHRQNQKEAAMTTDHAALTERDRNALVDTVDLDATVERLRAEAIDAALTAAEGKLRASAEDHRELADLNPGSSHELSAENFARAARMVAALRTEQKEASGE